MGSTPIISTRIIVQPSGWTIIFCLDIVRGSRTPSAKPNIIGCLRSKRWAEPIDSHHLHQNDSSTFRLDYYFLFGYCTRESNPLGEAEHNRVFAQQTMGRAHRLPSSPPKIKVASVSLRLLFLYYSLFNIHHSLFIPAFATF